MRDGGGAGLVGGADLPVIVPQAVPPFVPQTVHTQRSVGYAVIRDWGGGRGGVNPALRVFVRAAGGGAERALACGGVNPALRVSCR